jgi:hypothetical protein
VEQIDRWPIAESVRLIVDERTEQCDGWTLWRSSLDRWGVYQMAKGIFEDSGERREDVWRRLYRPRALEGVVS